MTIGCGDGIRHAHGEIRECAGRDKERIERSHLYVEERHHDLFSLRLVFPFKEQRAPRLAIVYVTRRSPKDLLGLDTHDLLILEHLLDALLAYHTSLVFFF